MPLPPTLECKPVPGCNRYTPCGVVDAAALQIPQSTFLRTVHASQQPGQSFSAVALKPSANAREHFWKWLVQTHGASKFALRITGPVADGFWVRALWVLAHASWARTVGLNFSVAYTSERDSYHDTSRQSDDGFSQYFEPLDEILPDARTTFVQLDCFAAARLWERAANYALDYSNLTEQRRARSALIDALPLRIRPRFIAAADFYWDSQRMPRGQPVLGVHLRGTDKQRWKVPVERVAAIARAYVCHEPRAVVFVATDDGTMLARFRSLLPEATRVIVRDALRSNSILNAGVHASSLGHSTHRTASRLATDAIVDTLLLSRCTFLLKSISAVSEFAIYLSPTLREPRTSYDLNFALDRDQPRPAWLGACRTREGHRRVWRQDHGKAHLIAVAATEGAAAGGRPSSAGSVVGGLDASSAIACHSGFRTHFAEHSYPTKFSAAPEIPPVACDEAAEYARRCVHAHAAMRAELSAHQGTRALYIMYGGRSVWGMGHVLALAYRLHDLCRHLRRYCLLSLYDMELGRLFGYASGHSWEPTDAALDLYGGKRNASTYQIDAPQLDRMYNLLEADGAPLVRLNIGKAHRPASPHDSRMELSLPMMPWDLSSLDGLIVRDATSGLGSWRHRPPVGARAPPKGADAHLTKCFCRFVTAPRFDVPPSRHRTTYHLRTGFADVPDVLLANARRNDSESRLWAAQACPALATAGGPEELHVISDSPGLVRQLAPRGAAADAAGVEWEGGSTRSWDVGFGARRRAALDTVLAGRATLLYATYPSSFLRPAIARSMCVRHVLAADHPSSACRPLPRVFPRGFFEALRTAIRRRARGARRKPAEDNWACFLKLAPALTPDHPCLAAADPTRCSARFVAAMM